MFIDITPYLKSSKKSAHEFVQMILIDVYKTTGITATTGIETNLYLAKVVIDIVAKHVQADAERTRIANLDKVSYRKMVWNYVPLLDFWRVGNRYTKKLNAANLFTIGDIAKYSFDYEIYYIIFLV